MKLDQLKIEAIPASQLAKVLGEGTPGPTSSGPGSHTAGLGSNIQYSFNYQSDTITYDSAGQANTQFHNQSCTDGCDQSLVTTYFPNYSWPIPYTELLETNSGQG